jgi:hypothetical protein
MWRFRNILLFNDIDEKNMSTYTWRVLDPKDESSTTVVVYDDSGKQRITRHLTLTKDEFCGLHIPARSERTLNSIMVKELAREKREIEEAKKKAEERSALRQSEIAYAKATWPDKPIVSHTVHDLCMHKDRSICNSFWCRKYSTRPTAHVWAPTDATKAELRRIAIEKLVAEGIAVPFQNRAGRSDSSGSDSDGGSRGGYRSRRRSRRRGRKLRKRTRKH